MPSIRVHAWGGLGSQLFAVALIYDLQRRFPKRRITLVLHEGGVTKRISEIDYLFTLIKKIKKSDFIESKSSFDPLVKNLAAQSRNEKKLSSKIKNFLLRSGILGSANSNEEFTRLRFWVFEIRGHYSYRTISIDTLKQIYTEIEIASGSPNDIELLENSVAVHYRLGDLTKLSSKGPIKKNDLKIILISLHEYQYLNCLIFSDSLKLAGELLVGAWNPRKLLMVDVSSLKMLWQASNSKIFIGTNSKLSIWAALFIMFKNVDSTMYMPKQLMNNFEKIIATELIDSNRNYY